MADYAEKYSDKQADELAKRIAEIFGEAAKDIKQKMASFQKQFVDEDSKMRQRLNDDKITESAYEKWKKDNVFRSEQWQKKLDDITKVYVNADQKAKEIISGTSKNVFAEAANYTAHDIDKHTKGAVAFDLYDKHTVEQLIKDDPTILPSFNVDKKKDYIWNEKRVKNSVLQGILQGESISDIGKRLYRNLSANNAGKMEMFARTAVTGAQNAGRMQMLHDAQEKGIVVKKKWLATHDNRVRDAHAYLDGQTVEVDEPFVTEDGREIMFPADPNADADLVYNCRCTLTYVYDVKASRENLQEKALEEIPDEIQTKGYVGLSGEQSDEFMQMHHNRRIIGRRGSNTMDGKQSRRINSALRKGEMPTESADIKLMRVLDSEINKNELPQDMTLFRGVSLNAFEDSKVFDGFKETIVSMDDFKRANGSIDYDAWGKVYEAAVEKDLAEKLSRARKLIGETIEDKGYMQVSASSQRNIFAASEIGMQIHASKGTHAYISDYLGESEIILQRGTRFKIVGATIAEVILQNGNRVKTIQLIVELLN